MQECQSTFPDNPVCSDACKQVCAGQQCQLSMSPTMQYVVKASVVMLCCVLKYLYFLFNIATSSVLCPTVCLHVCLLM